MKPFFEFIAYKAVVGSRAYGLVHEGSDTDLKGFFVPPAELQWSLEGVPDQIDDEKEQSVFWELGKCVRLALRANPTVLETLNAPEVLQSSEIAEDLLSIRDAFISKHAYARYQSYAEDQFKRLNKGAEEGEPNWKHAMHMLRLLICGETLMREGFVRVDVTEYREKLLSVKRGAMKWANVIAWQEELNEKLKNSFETTELPDEPDVERVNAFLISARRRMVDYVAPVVEAEAVTV